MKRLAIGFVVAVVISLGIAFSAEAFKIPCNPTCPPWVSFCC